MKKTTTNRDNRSRTPVSQFRPRNDEERVIYEIARTLGETHIDYLKSVYDLDGYAPIWSAWEEYKLICQSGTKIKHPPSFFTYLVEKRRPPHDRK